MRYYEEDDYLLLSGVQHFAFCPRQWALIHLEDQWQENYLTAMGRILHKNVHEGGLVEKRGGSIIFRSLKVSSSRLGISGVCDVVEFHQAENGIPLINYDGLWTPYPVEYKRGKAKDDDCDRLQLCAQTVCLEEMLCCRIEQGALFYGEPRRREKVVFTANLRATLEKATEAMHDLFSRKHTPKSKRGKHCSRCSMQDQCLPKLCAKKVNAVQKFLEDNV